MQYGVFPIQLHLRRKKKKMRGILFFCLISSCAGFEKKQISFVSDFIKFEITGKIRVCNFFTCSGLELNLKLAKKISENFQCTMTVQNITEEFNWYRLAHLQMFLLDLSCPRAEKILERASALHLFKGDYFWLILDSERSNLMDIFSKLNLTIISQVYVGRETFKETQILSLYKRDPWDYPIVERVAVWKDGLGINFVAVRSPAVRRQNMEGRLFTAGMVIVNDDSLNHMDDMVDIHIDNLSKLNYVFVNLVISGLNASVKYLLARSWGEPDSNGIFSDMLGYAQRGEAEILVSPMIMTYVRMEVIEYIAMTAKTRIKFIFLSPPLSYKNNIYILPFASEVWYCTIGVFAMSTFLLYITSGYENGFELKVRRGKIWQRRKDRTVKLIHDEVTKLPKSWGDIILMNVGTLCQQDIVVEPKGIPGRVLILHVKIALLFLYISYSAAIVVLLQSSDTSITTLADLLRSDMKLGVHEISYNHYYFKTASDPVRKGLSKKVDPVKDFLSPEEGVSRVRTGLFAFYVERTPGYHMVNKLLHEDEKCRLQELYESYIPDLDPTVAITKYCPYSKILRIMFKRLHETGLTRRQVLRATAKKPSCSENVMTYVSVSFIDCRHALVFFGFGVLVSLIALICEIIHKKSRKNRGTKKFQN